MSGDFHILNSKNPRLTFAQGENVLAICEGVCPCCGKKQILISGKGTIAFQLDEARLLLKKIQDLILLAQSEP